MTLKQRRSISFLGKLSSMERENLVFWKGKQNGSIESSESLVLIVLREMAGDERLEEPRNV